MKYSAKLLKMASAIDKTLPCDGYASIDEWVQRYDERMKDMGYTADKMAELTRSAKEAVAFREESRTTLTQVIANKLHLPSDSTLLPLGQAFVLDMLKSNFYPGIHPGRNMARYAKHIAYWSRRSTAIRSAYSAMFKHIINGSYPYLQQTIATIAHNSPENMDKYARVHKHRYWAMVDAGMQSDYAFYKQDDFIKCPKTNLEAPLPRMVITVTDEEGRTTRLHPSLIDSGKIVRDPLTGSFVWRDAVEWVTLDTGEQAWRRPNEARGAIFLEDGQWMRGTTNGRIASYHGGRRDWRGQRTTQQYAGHIGVELEIGFKTTGHSQKFLSRYVDERGRFIGERPFLIESDSSLSGIVGGAEIISEPLRLHEGYQAPDSHWRWLLDKLVAGGAEGWKHRSKAGIHVNMDASDRSSNDILKYVVFIHNAAAISKFISGRKSIYGQGDSGGSAISPAGLAVLDTFISTGDAGHTGGYERIDAARFKTICGDTKFNDRALSQFAGRGKYQPVHIRNSGKVLETRIFGSNIRYEGFMACVEYCVGAMEFVSGLSDDLAVLDLGISAQFRAWLSSNHEKYPSLASRIGVMSTTAKPIVAARPLAELTA